MRFLIVDESASSREALAAMLRAHWPGSETDFWSPLRDGHPRGALGDGGYAAVLLDARPGGGDGIAWVSDLARTHNPPPVLLITDEGGEHNAVRAMKAGAADFLRRADLDAERLARSVEEALREQEARRFDATEPDAKAALARTQSLDVRRIGAPVREPAQPVPGYRLLRKVGEGGSAQVFLAERERDGLQLVLKILDPGLRDDATFLKRFEQEYRLLAQIQDEHVALIFDHGFSGEHPYFSMEYFPGGSLKERIAQGMSSLAALRMLSQIAKALSTIHAHGIVHRDLKPQNILFRENGRPAIVDFGLAKSLGSSAQLTQFGEVLATPRYMSPEQCTGRPVDARTDLYSLGAVFYEMLTGEKLFGALPPLELITQHVSGAVPRLPAKLAGYQGIVDRLLAKKADERFQSARELFGAVAI